MHFLEFWFFRDCREPGTAWLRRRLRVRVLREAQSEDVARGSRTGISHTKSSPLAAEPRHPSRQPKRLACGEGKISSYHFLLSSPSPPGSTPAAIPASPAPLAAVRGSREGSEGVAGTGPCRSVTSSSLRQLAAATCPLPRELGMTVEQRCPRPGAMPLRVRCSSA